MKRIPKCSFLLCLIGFFTFFSFNKLAAQGFRFGFGGSLLDVKSSYISIPSFQKSAYSISFGWQFNDNFSCLLGATIVDRIKTDTTQNIYYPDDTAEFGIVDVSIRYYFVFENEQKIMPWLGFGYAIENANWDTFFYSVTTTGVSISLGFEYKIGYGFLFDVFYQYQTTDGYDTYDYGPYQLTTTEIGVQIHYLIELENLR